MTKLFEGGFSTGHGFLREPNDIQSYAALACIAIQSNQNDQHGGQSIPNFDYGMANGREKDLPQALLAEPRQKLDVLFMMCEDGEPTRWRTSYRASRRKTGSYPVLAEDNGYREAERGRSAENVLARTKRSEALQRRALKYAHKEIRRATYQAMEALVHNLNTMHSRAGAQIPFSSINYGTDTSPEGRMVIENVMLATEAGLGNGETPIFPIHIFKVKEGVNYNPGRSELRSVQAGLPRVG